MTQRPSSRIGRREFLSSVGGLAAASLLGSVHGAEDSRPAARRPGRLKQSVCRSVFHGLKLDK